MPRCSVLPVPAMQTSLRKLENSKTHQVDRVKDGWCRSNSQQFRSQPHTHMHMYIYICIFICICISIHKFHMIPLRSLKIVQATPNVQHNFSYCFGCFFFWFHEFLRPILPPWAPRSWNFAFLWRTLVLVPSRLQRRGLERLPTRNVRCKDWW